MKFSIKKMGFKILAVGLMSVSVFATQSYAAGDKYSDSPIADEGKANVVLLRGKERSNTRSTRFNVYIGEDKVARLGVNNAKQVSMPAGDYVVSSNFYRSEGLPVTLEDGKTYYIKAIMKKDGNRFKTTYELVTEDYAFNALPELKEDLI